MDKNTFIAEFTKDHPELLKKELAAIRAISDENDYELIAGNIALLHGNIANYTESAFLKVVGRVLWSGRDLNEIENVELPDGRFYVRANENGRDNPAVERMLGQALGGKGRISFDSPDFVVRAYKLDKWYVMISSGEGHRKDMEKRTAPMRPFFSPVSLHPYIARLMINLTRTRTGETVLDPFCGTGGILIEAATMGRKVIGGDASLSMVAGARMNFKYFGMDPKTILNSTVEKLKIEKKVDAIATDFPYGRSSAFFQYSENFVTDAFKKFNNFLKEDGLCVAISNSGNIEFGTNRHFEMLDKLEIRRHKSLTRYIYILKNI